MSRRVPSSRMPCPQKAPGAFSHSNDHNPEHIRDVIRQVRAESDPEILVMSGTVVTKADLRAYVAKRPKPRQQEILERKKGS